MFVFEILPEKLRSEIAPQEISDIEVLCGTI